MRFPEHSLHVLHLLEPNLEFGAKQTTAHPKDGLFLYGPHDKQGLAIRIGVVATADGTKLFHTWLAQIKKRVEVPPPKKGEKQDRLHLANFPGLEEAFGITVNENELVTCVLDVKAINDASLTVNQYEAVSKVVRLYVDRIRRHIQNEERAIDVWVLVVPEFVYERCTPKAKRTGLPLVKGDFGKNSISRPTYRSCKALLIRSPKASSRTSQTFTVR